MSNSINIQKVQLDLTCALAKCQVRGLVQNTAWLSELLLSTYLTSGKTSEQNPHSALPTLSFQIASEYTGLSSIDIVRFTLARSYFDAQEYSRCGHLLAPSGVNQSHPLLDFLHFYARYMSIEKHHTDNALVERKSNNWSSGNDVSPCIESYRKELSDLKSDMEYAFIKSELVSEDNMNTFLESNVDVYTAFVYALIRIRLGFQQMAIKILAFIVKKDPTAWPAWSELVTLLEDREQLDRMFPVTASEDSNWMVYFFRAKALLRLQESERALSILQTLSTSGFQSSCNLKADIAEAHDRLRDLNAAMEQFKQLHAADPYRLADTDVYSNVLFVKGEHNELAFLARRCAQIDKYRPQTCCVLGNFYGLRGQHDKAVLYFQRALRLQPRYALVWTLIGHEYVELRHLKLAIHAYNQAIIHNRQDYRAWYGLGQLYEFVKQLDYALYYYKQAQYLRPTDSRIIVALGEMYEALGNMRAAKKCFWRAYCVGDLEGEALNYLARCFDKAGEEAEAAAAYTQFIQQCNRLGVNNEAELGQAYRYLANYHLQHGHHNDAVIAVNKCLDFPEIREEAKALCLQLTLLSGASSSSAGGAAVASAVSGTTTTAAFKAPFQIGDKREEGDGSDEDMSLRSVRQAVRIRLTARRTVQPHLFMPRATTTTAGRVDKDDDDDDEDDDAVAASLEGPSEATSTAPPPDLFDSQESD